MTALADNVTFDPVVGLVATYEVCAPDGRVLGVIAENSEFDWRVLSTRHGTREPVTGRHPTRDDAANTLIQGAREANLL